MNDAHSPDNIVGFITGNVLVSILVWIHFDVVAFEMKLIMTIVFGLLGGAAGMAGKDMYNWLKSKWPL